MSKILDVICAILFVIIPNLALGESDLAWGSNIYSMRAMYPEGGSSTGAPAFGLRRFIGDKHALSALFQIEYDKVLNTSSLGVSFEYQSFLSSQKTACPYLYSYLSGGKNQGPDIKLHARQMQLAAAGGLGVEIFLLPTLSTFIEGGIGARVLPADSINAGTATSKIGLSYNFEL